VSQFYVKILTFDYTFLLSDLGVTRKYWLVFLSVH